MNPVKALNHHYSIENPASIYDEEAMTALELAGRTVGKVNELVKAYGDVVTHVEVSIMEQNEAIPQKAEQAVQSHIDNGDFDRSINEYAGGLEGRLNNLLGQVVPGSSTMDAEIIDGRTDYKGTQHATIGEAIRAQVFRNCTKLSDPVDVNTVIEEGHYIISNTTSTNLPTGVKGSVLEVLNYDKGGRWITQLVRDNKHTADEVYIRHGENPDYSTNSKNFGAGLAVSWGEWKPLHNFRKNINTAGIDLNTLTQTGTYVIQVTDSVNRPEGITGGYLLEVVNFQPWVVQTVYTINDNQFFTRRLRYDTLEGTQWVSVFDAPSNRGYTIVNFGDSVTDFETGGTSVSGFLSQFTGANCINMGFDGCRMTYRSGNYGYYSMCQLASSIVSGDFSPQLLHAPTERFAVKAQMLSNIEWDKVDIVTIAFGTNDFTAGVNIESDISGDDVFVDALRYSIEAILTAYPNIRIVLVTPTWRYWMDESGNVTETSDDKANDKGDRLYDFVDKVIEVANEYHLPVVDPYNTMGINLFNRGIWFREGDGTHPSSNGQKMYAKLIANTIRGM